MRDKRPLLSTKDVGNDEDSAGSLIRGLEALVLELKAFDATVQKLSQNADNLIERQHYDAENIKIKKVKIS